jgi:large subunit ribosomal protein L4
MSRLARRSALSCKTREDKIKIIVDFDWEDGKTANARNFLKAFALKSGNTLILTGDNRPYVYRACKNIPGLEVNKAIDVSTRQILKSDQIFIQKSALNSICEVLGK